MRSRVLVEWLIGYWYTDYWYTDYWYTEHNEIQMIV
jgi:hypothetical protein